MPRPEAPVPSKRFVREAVCDYRIGNAAEKVIDKLRLPMPKVYHDEESLANGFSKHFSSLINTKLIARGASFDKVRNAYEETIKRFVKRSGEKGDQLAKKVAARLVSDGEHVLQNLNPEFDSDEWYEAQREVVYPGIVQVPRKSDSVYS